MSKHQSPTDDSLPPVADSLGFSILRRCRWALLPFVCGAAISTLLLQMAMSPQTWESWSRYFPYALRPVFHDLWITQQHLHDADTGIDPLSDPQSEFAYPRPVLLLRHLGVHHLPTEWLGFAQGLMLTLAVVMVLRPFTPRRAIATSCLFFTPPMMLGFERGNLDFALFLLCAVCAWQWSRSAGIRKLVWPIGAAIAGALLKLYPVFAMFAGAFAETGRRRLLWLLGIAGVMAYWYVDRAELGLVMAKVPVSTSAAWGCVVFFTRLGRFMASTPESFMWFTDVRWPLVALATYGVGAVAAGFVGLRLSPQFIAIRIPRLELTYYWVGAAICCGSFAGANLAYRWVFVLLTVPLLLRCIHSLEPAVALWGRLTVAALLASLAAPLGSHPGIFVVTQACNWACILLLITGCMALRVSEKSPVFAFILRVFVRKPAPELVLAWSKTAEPEPAQR